MGLHQSFPATFTPVTMVLTYDIPDKEKLDQMMSGKDIDALKKDISDQGTFDHIESTWDLFIASGAARWDPKILDESINHGKELLTLIPPSNKMRETLIDLLVNLLEDRLEANRDPADLNMCVQLHTEGLKLHPPGHPLHTSHLNMLALTLVQRFKLHADAKDIAEAIQLYEEALEFSPPSDPGNYMAINNLANAIKAQFDHGSNQGDIDRTIQLYRQALELKHPDSIVALNNLAVGLHDRFIYFRQRGDLNEAIGLHEKALALCSSKHPERARTLDALGLALKTRFLEGENAADIDLAVEMHRQCLKLCVRSRAEIEITAMCLNNLGNAIHTRLIHKGALDDIDEVLILHQKALDLRRFPDSVRAMSLNNLALAFKTRFEQRGDLNDIDRAVDLNRKALVIRSVSNHKDQSMSLNNLATTIHIRCRERIQKGDIDEVIQLHQKALSLLPPAHPDYRTYLQNLGSALNTRFSYTGKTEDMDEAIQLLRNALGLCPAPHSTRGIFLNNLAIQLQKRFNLHRNPKDIEEVLTYTQEGMKLFPSPHPYYKAALVTFSNALRNKIVDHSSKEDIDEVVALHREIVQLFPPPHPEHGSHLGKLALALILSYECVADPSVLVQAMEAFEQAAKYSSCSPFSRFKYAKYWANIAVQHDPPSAIKAYRIAIDHLPTLASLDLNLYARHEVLGELSQDNLASAAAISAIELHQYEDAIELLEAARSIFWSQALRLRSPLDDLKIADPELASKVSTLSKELERGTFREISKDDLADNVTNVIVVEAEGTRLRQCNQEWDETLNSVRKLPGFESFMRPKGINLLKNAAINGTIVILCAGKSACHLLLLESGKVQCIPLAEGTTDETMDSLSQALRPLSGGRGGIDTQRLMGKKVYEQNQHPNDHFGAILKSLWDLIAAPIIKALNLQKSSTPPRLWWCPTGPFTFLPIHAAGIYNTEKPQCIADYVISSYTPTLTALLSSPAASNDFKITAVIQPQTPEYRSLPYTENELSQVVTNVPGEWLTIFGTLDSPASIGVVLDHLKSSSIMHFACHGVQDSANALDSGLLIGNGRLKVSQIMEKNQHIAK
ncbi:hypothetical protein DFH09DRAFT_1107403 [Mycena vulgaris]|nr:hypothetical protein DFH09DRAFT_1107403 [Mycena vulgaris]